VLTRAGESLKHGDPKAQASRLIDKENRAGHRDSPGMGQFTAISSPWLGLFGSYRSIRLHVNIFSQPHSLLTNHSMSSNYFECPTT